MFSPIDLVKVLGPNSVSWIHMSKDLGTLEAGKMADIVLLAAIPWVELRRTVIGTL